MVPPRSGRFPSRGRIRWRFLLSFVVVILAIFLARGCELDDEEQLRRIVLAMGDAFNDASARGCVEPLAENFHERVYNLDRMELRRILAGIFITERNRSDGSFRWRVECKPEEAVVEFPQGDPDRAHLEVPARFYRRGSEGDQPTWEVRFTGTAARVDGEWRLVRAAFVTIGGRCPF